MPAVMQATQRAEIEFLMNTLPLHIDEKEIELHFIHSSGPGGQNVNKVATAVQLRFDVKNSVSLPHHVRERLKQIAGNRLTTDGVLVISAHRFRTQGQNRQDALKRLNLMVHQATVRQKPRKKTLPTFSSGKRRLKSKAKRGSIKQSRRTKHSVDD
jgi:ribosome-associated protein